MPISLFANTLNVNYDKKNYLSDKLVISNKFSPENKLQPSQQDKIIYDHTMCLANLILKTVLDTANAILEKRYRKFDALVSNFGCQITALQVQDFMRTTKLYTIARDAKNHAEQALLRLKNLDTSNSKIPKEGTNLLQYAKTNEFDCMVKPCIAELVKLRLLCIVNDFAQNDNPLEEKLITNYSLLSSIEPSVTPLLAKLPVAATQKASKKVQANCTIIKKFIDGLQVTTSYEAITFLKTKAKNTNNQLLQKLNKKNEKRKGIICSNLKANMSIVLQSITGVAVIANKMKINNKPRENAQPFCIYLKMPEQAVLSEKEITLIDGNEPLIYIEGYVRNADKLRTIIQQGQFNNLIMENCKGLKADGTPKDKENPPLPNENFQLDHFFCTSMSEIRNLTAENQNKNGTQ